MSDTIYMSEQDKLQADLICALDYVDEFSRWDYIEFLLYPFAPSILIELDVKP